MRTGNLDSGVGRARGVSNFKTVRGRNRTRPWPTHDCRQLCCCRGIQEQRGRPRVPGAPVSRQTPPDCTQCRGLISLPRDPAADGTGSCGVWGCAEQAVPQPPARSMFVLKAPTRNHGADSAPWLQRVQTCACCLQIEASNPNKVLLMCYRGMLCNQQVSGVPCLRRTQPRLRSPSRV